MCDQLVRQFAVLKGDVGLEDAVGRDAGSSKSSCVDGEFRQQPEEVVRLRWRRR